MPTPAIDRIADEGTVFRTAITPSPITLVAHASILTGLDPPGHGVRNNGTYRLADRAVTLAEILRDNGYRTAAFLGAAVLDRRYGLAQGFDEYDDRMTAKPGAAFEAQRRGEDVVRSALGWLDAQGAGPTFVWVHLFDPHTPYEAPEPERSRYRDAPYDGEIAYSDRVIGELLAAYRERRMEDRTVVVFAADHGEGLGEHGEPTHGVFLFDSTVRVPLLIRAPGFEPGVVERPVRLVDLLPTVCSLLGLSSPPGIDGQSLLPLLRGETLEERTAYVETFLPLLDHRWFSLTGLRTERWKLIEGPVVELYDIEADPGEHRDLAASRPQVVASLRRRLASARSTRGVEAERLTRDDVTRRQLLALGYLSTESAEPASGLDPYTDLRLRLTVELYRRGLVYPAAERARELLGQVPEATGAWRQLTEILSAQEGRARHPIGLETPQADEIRNFLSLAEIALREGDSDRVQSLLTRITRENRLDRPSASRARSGLAPVPDRVEIAEILSGIGTDSWERLAYENALHAYLLAAALVPDAPSVHHNLGLTWERLSDIRAALAAYRRTLELAPAFADTREKLRYCAAVSRRLPPGDGAERSRGS